MQQHIKVLGILNIIYGSLAAVSGLIVLVIFGGLAGLAGVSGDHDAMIASGFLGLLGGVIGIVLVVLGAPSIIAGVALLGYKSWARVLTIVLSALHLINVPFGTALGIYGLWVLLKPESEALFRSRRPQAWPAPTV